MTAKSQILNVQPEPQPNSDMKLIVPTSSPTIGNTHVVGSTVDLEDIFELDESDPVNKMLLRLPIVFDWVEFKGKTVFMGVNYDASRKAKKPMVDIFYCATRALNDVILFTTQWDKNKFKPSHLGQQF
jgi:hypothetical protein